MRTSAGRRFLWVVGPGLMVMLADTDAGSVATAAQSGAAWGYRLLFLQVLLVPVLYLVMELTVRIGVTTGKGHAELIREQFGSGWAIVSVGTLVVAAVGALVTEFAGIAGVAALYGIPQVAAVVPVAAFLVWLVLAGTYRRVELVGIALGAFELAFVVAAVLVHPHTGELARGLSPAQPLSSPGFLALVAANIGAVVMPWMVFYQQGAVLDKGLRPRDLRLARLDTALGAVLTQVVMAAVLVVAAATLHVRGRSLTDLGDLANALSPAFGATTARVVVSAGVAGAALVAAIVVSLALAWAVAECSGAPRSLADRPTRARLFYGIYVAAVAGGAALVLASGSLVRLAVHVEILNALLLPLVLGFLVALAFRVLPRPYAPRRRERLALAGTVAAVVAIGFLSVALSFGL
jgi:Mn2+/Fe2+ NRAMP family transporter